MRASENHVRPRATRPPLYVVVLLALGAMAGRAACKAGNKSTRAAVRATRGLRPTARPSTPAFVKQSQRRTIVLNEAAAAGVNVLLDAALSRTPDSSLASRPTPPSSSRPRIATAPSALTAGQRKWLLNFWSDGHRDQGSTEGARVERALTRAREAAKRARLDPDTRAVLFVSTIDFKEADSTALESLATIWRMEGETWHIGRQTL